MLMNVSCELPAARSGVLCERVPTYYLIDYDNWRSCMQACLDSRKTYCTF